MKNEGRTTRITIAFTDDELATLEDWMRAQGMIRGRSEAIRQLIAAGLEAHAPGTPAPVPKVQHRTADEGVRDEGQDNAAVAARLGKPRRR
ncbi:MAG: hypothetical protein JNJ59_14955 [Deltaproteobacteria bacterium]|nr:hypothetical protein [Deltaproteobacteria bacterium]